jgi:N-acetylmuramoyl-L-alanine amidase
MSRSRHLLIVVFCAVGLYVMPADAQTSPQLPPRSLLQVGAKGNEVSELQGILRLMGFYDAPIDGIFDAGTATAVNRFQQFAGLTQDGIVGAGTWAKLLPPAAGETLVPVIITTPIVTNPVNPVVTTPIVAKSEILEPVLRKGAIGPAVSRLQRRLSAIGLYKEPIDGGFGEVTEIAVKAAQRRAGLTEDGVVGPATWKAVR